MKGYDLQEPIQDLTPNFKLWTPLPDAVLARSVFDLSRVLQNEEGLFQLIVLYTFSSLHFLERRFAEALIAYWAAIEACVNIEWARLLDNEAADAAFGLPKRRRERLTNTGAFTASVMLETLFLLRRLPPEIYEALNSVREQRNKWMHKLQAVTESQALEARRVCEQMFRQTFSFDIESTNGGVGGAGGGIFKDVFCKWYPHKAHLFDI